MCHCLVRARRILAPRHATLAAASNRKKSSERGLSPQVMSRLFVTAQEVLNKDQCQAACEIFEACRPDLRDSVVISIAVASVSNGSLLDAQRAPGPLTKKCRWAASTAQMAHWRGFAARTVVIEFVGNKSLRLVRKAAIAFISQELFPKHKPRARGPRQHVLWFDGGSSIRSWVALLDDQPREELQCPAAEDNVGRPEARWPNDAWT